MNPAQQAAEKESDQQKMNSNNADVTSAAKLMPEEDPGNFTAGSIPKKILRFMLPVLGALVLQAAYGAVDLLVVGRFGTTAGLSGVSTGSQVLNLVTLVITGSSMSITVLISRYLGQKRPQEISPLLGAGFTLYSVVAAILFVIMVFFAGPLTILMQAPAEAVDLTATYIRICGAGIFFIVAYNVLSAIFRGLGDSRSPLIFVGIACAVNVVGDLFFVAVLHMNVAGAALATVMAQAVSVVFALLMLRKKDIGLHLSRKSFGFNHYSASILQIGIPLALQDLLTQISFVVICAFVNRLGLNASSGYGVACKIINFAMLVPSALMQSLAAFVSMNVGAGKEDRAAKGTRIGMGIGLVIGTCVFCLVYFAGDILSSIFTSDAAVIQDSFLYLRGFTFESIVTAVLFSMIGYYNGHECTLWTMCQGMAQTFLVRIPFAYVMSIQPNASLTMIGLASPLASLFGSILNLLYLIPFRKKLRTGVDRHEDF